MKFRNKLLLSIWGLVLGLLVITFVILSYLTRLQIESRFTEDLRSNYSTIGEISQLRQALDARVCQVIAETPRLKAVVELRDNNTALQLSQELNHSMATDLFVLFDEEGNQLVGLLNGVPAHLRPTQLELMKPNQAQTLSTNVLRLGKDVYRTASSRVIIGNDIVGTVVIGFRILHEDIEFMKSLINSEVVLLVDTTFASTSLQPEDALDLRGASLSSVILDEIGKDGPNVFTVDARKERYQAAIYNLNQSANRKKRLVAYLLLKPIERELKKVLTPILDTFFAVSFVVLMIGGGIGYIISKGITRPIAALVRGTTEISRGNYDYRMDVETGGELKFLAQKFEEMSMALKEKIHQLGQRNIELEHTLRQLKDTEQELLRSERLATTGRLTAQLSHEINNPIHNIQSCLQTALQRFPAGAPHRELLEAALEEIERLSKLTHQMLDVYKTSVVQEDREPVNVNDIVQEVISSSRTSFDDSNINVRTLLNRDIMPIDGSRDKLKQIFLNLFINAKDAMPDGGTLTVETFQVNGDVMVTVTDNGVGIPPENIHKIFDAFFTTKKTVSGVGLGLSVTYGIVQQHSGTISVNSKSGEGTTFTLRFPVSSFSQKV